MGAIIAGIVVGLLSWAGLLVIAIGVILGAVSADVASKAYARFGYIPIFVSLVSDEPPPATRLPSPRLLHPEKPA